LLPLTIKNLLRIDISYLISIFVYHERFPAQKANAKMVTSVVPMMMMTVCSLSLVEIVQTSSRHKCIHDVKNIYCDDDEHCRVNIHGDVYCCPGNVFGVSGCCKSGAYGNVFHACCYDTVYANINENGVYDVNCCGVGDKVYGTSGCCNPGDQPYSTGGCCASDDETYAIGGCCPKGQKPWQMDDGSMSCCPDGQRCSRTNDPLTRELRDPVAASVGRSGSVGKSASVGQAGLVSRPTPASSYETMMKNEK